MIEVYVESIRVNMTNYKRVVMLKEKDGERFLPIWIGHFEADAIAIPMQKVPTKRPLTHDLLVATIERLGARCLYASITRLEDETFYAAVVADQNGKQIELDARPSDAIAAAIRVQVPIYVEDSVIDRAAMTFDQASESHGSGDTATAETQTYLPGAEPVGGQAPEPFGQLGAVTGPALAGLQRVIADARRARRSSIDAGDLLLRLRQERAFSTRILTGLSVEVSELRDLVEQELEHDRPRFLLTSAAEAVIRRAAEEASRLQESSVGTEYLLLALAAESEGSVAPVFEKLGISQDTIRRQIAVLLAPPPPDEAPPTADQP